MAELDSEAKLAKRVLIPDDVWQALTSPDKAGYPVDEVLNWSGEEIFEKYCEWHGLLGSWHRTLWRVVPELRRIK